MAKESIVQIRMDTELKSQVEQMYKNMGTSFAEAVRIFAAQSIIQKSMPIDIKAPKTRKVGLFDKKVVIPDDFDDEDDEIIKMFEADL